MKRALVMGAAGIAAIAWLWPDRATPPVQDHLQAAVLGDGFVVTHTHGGTHHVIEVDPGGRETVDHSFDRAGDVRVVGTGAGPTAVFEDARRIRLVTVQDNRELGVFGKSVRLMCDGFASNQHRFAVGWVESDNKLWFVHGPTVAALTASEAPELEVAAPPMTWCALTSAGKKIALSWREKDRLLISTCTPKRCSMAGATKLDANEAVLALGCNEDNCLLASRTKSGMTRVSLLVPSGAIKWSKRLEANPLAVSIAAAGDRDFAFGYHAGSDVDVFRVDAKAAIHRVRTAPGTSAPALSWNQGRLLISHATNDGITNRTLKFP